YSLSVQCGGQKSPRPRPGHRDHRAGAARSQRRAGDLVHAGRPRDQAGTRLAVVGHRLRARHRAGGRLSHPLDQSRRRQPRPVPAAARAAAAATVAMRVLARKNSAVMAMLGAGDTARAAVPVMAKAFALKEIRVTSRTPASRESYAKEIGKEYSLNVRPVESTEEALKGADVVVSATTTSTPFVKESWLGPGITVYSIGKNQEME